MLGVIARRSEATTRQSSQRAGRRAQKTPAIAASSALYDSPLALALDRFVASLLATTLCGDDMLPLKQLHHITLWDFGASVSVWARLRDFSSSNGTIASMNRSPIASGPGRNSSFR